jgi:hypothetical protein
MQSYWSQSSRPFDMAMVAVGAQEWARS